MKKQFANMTELKQEMLNACIQYMEAFHTDVVLDMVLVDELAAINLKNITVADTTCYVADGNLAEHTVTSDETLTRIARQYYGDKRLWPYIVKYNNMDRPNDLCRGMKLVIPRLLPRN